MITKRKNGEFQFNLKAGNGQTILASEGYTTLAACKNGIESVKKNAPEDARYERKEAKNGAPYFNLKAGNGQVIGSSEMYSSVAARENGIESVKKNAVEDARYERKEAKNGAPYFNLKAANGQVIGSSEMYSSVAARDNGIESVKKNAPEAEVVDETQE